MGSDFGFFWYRAPYQTNEMMIAVLPVYGGVAMPPYHVWRALAHDASNLLVPITVRSLPRYVVITAHANGYPSVRQTLWDGSFGHI